MSGGWGSGAWGASAWGIGGGGGGGGGAVLFASIPISENVIRLEFDQPIYFSGLGDQFDGALPDHYSISEVAGTVGLDGNPVRPVAVLYAALAPVTEGFGNFVDITLDRPLTPYPSAYTLTVSGLQTQAFGPVSSGLVQPVTGLYRNVEPVALDTAVPSKDFANPQTQSAMLDPLPDAYNPLNLGTVVVDETGDYATWHRAWIERYESGDNVATNLKFSS